MFMLEPVIVVGTGRCGTSTVAKWLHEAGVCMGTRFSEEMNPGIEPGFWEDLDFKELNKSYQEIWRVRVLEDASFKRDLEALVQKKKKEALTPWGFKDPRTANPKVLPHYLDLLPKALWVHCFRPLDDCIDSWKRSWPSTPLHEITLTIGNRDRTLHHYFENLGILSVFLHFDLIKNGLGKGLLFERLERHLLTGERDENNALDAEGSIGVGSDNSGVG